MIREEQANGRTHEPSLRELTGDLDGVKALLLEKVQSLRDIVDERHNLYKERADSQKTAVDDALVAAKEKTEAAFAASKEAIVKAENSQTAYNVSHNDLLKKQDAMMPRHEVDRIVSEWREKFDDLKDQIGAVKEVQNKIGGKEVGLEKSQASMRWGIGTFIGIVGGIVGVLGMLGMFITFLLKLFAK